MAEVDVRRIISRMGRVSEGGYCGYIRLKLSVDIA
jgi:hypothetical protein